MCFKRKKALTMEEKKELILAGKSVPICIFVDKRQIRRIKREQRILANTFSKNM